MQTWVVIYRLNTGKVYGWFCRADSVGQAEQEFVEVMESPPWLTIKCICLLESAVVDACFALYQPAKE